MGSDRSIGLIAAVSIDGAIARGARTPWDAPADLARFARITRGHTVIMGRRTFESLDHRPLPDRRNLVVTRTQSYPSVETFPSVAAALSEARGVVWVIGGAGIFSEAMQYASVVDLTRIPVHITGREVVYFPPIPRPPFRAVPTRRLDADPALMLERYVREDA